MNKLTIIPFLTSFLSIIVLYVLGFIFKIEAFHSEFSSFNIEISLVPIFIGIAIGFITEFILKKKMK